MSTESKLPVLFIIGFVTVIYALVPLIYQKNKTDYDRRYWGKNRAWLKNTRYMAVIISVILMVYMIAITLSK